MNKRSGFTLLELAVVLLILTVVLGLVLPDLSSSLLRNDLKTSCRRLAGAIAHARNQAMLEGRLWELTLDLNTNTYWTSASDGANSADPGTVKKRQLLGEVRFKDVQQSTEETKTAGRVNLFFYPKGLAEPTVIHLASPGDQIQTLIVRAFSGRTRIQQGYVEAI